MVAAAASDTETLTDTRSRILAAAATLVAEGGVAALTTRAVAAAAKTQTPTIYRLFGDKRGLLDAVAEQGFAAYVDRKSARKATADPVQEMRDAFDAHIAFGLSHPAVFAIMNEVGREGSSSPATLTGLEVLRDRVHRIARAGRLRVPEDQATQLIQAVGNGTIATLLAMPEDERDPSLARLAGDTVMDAIVDRTVDRTRDASNALAIGLRARIAGFDALTPGEKLLMRELLDRVISASES